MRAKKILARALFEQCFEFRFGFSSQGFRCYLTDSQACLNDGGRGVADFAAARFTEFAQLAQQSSLVIAIAGQKGDQHVGANAQQCTFRKVLLFCKDLQGSTRWARGQNGPVFFMSGD